MTEPRPGKLSSQSGLNTKAKKKVEIDTPALIKTKVAAKRKSAVKKSVVIDTRRLALDVAVAAYYLAEKRHFAPNHALEDWLTAERQVLADMPGGNS
ncbi:MAG: DUF2934 domain-containing protein [Steroidobacteraceae bacterium]